MRQDVLLDQISMSELGSDRGLGRYAGMLARGVADLRGIEATHLTMTDTTSRAPASIRIQREIHKRRLKSEVTYHSTSVYHLPLYKNRPWICSIQDIIPIDLEDYRQLGLKSRLLFWNARKSDAILANSKYTKSRIVDRLQIPAERISTCLLPISPAFTPDRPEDSVVRMTEALARVGLSSAQPFVVALVDTRTRDSRKRYHWIDELAVELRSRGISMVVTGRGDLTATFANCEALGALNDVDLSTLYSLAVATYYPTAYEGQGLPPQEAMASGCPVVAYRNTSVQEVVESPQFLLDDPVPWELQQLSAPLPEDALLEAADRIQAWAESSVELAHARQIALALSEQHDWDSFVTGLDRFYQSYFQGR